MIRAGCGARSVTSESKGIAAVGDDGGVRPVAYTHLTLPTKRIGEVRVDAGAVRQESCVIDCTTDM